MSIRYVPDDSVDQYRPADIESAGAEFDWKCGAVSAPVNRFGSERAALDQGVPSILKPSSLPQEINNRPSAKLIGGVAVRSDRSVVRFQDSSILIDEKHNIVSV